MPIWNYNELTIEATTEELVNDWWIIKLTSEEKQDMYIFNLHKLFPEKYPEEYEEWEFELPEIRWQMWWKCDNTFDKYWDYHWCTRNTSTKWSFEMIANSLPEEFFNTWFDTAWWPPTLLLQKFHELSLIGLTNEYEEWWMWFEWTFICENWDCNDDQREYISTCEMCDEKKEDVKYYDSEWVDACDKCAQTKWLVYED